MTSNLSDRVQGAGENAGRETRLQHPAVDPNSIRVDINENKKGEIGSVVGTCELGWAGWHEPVLPVVFC